jgi:hypothetical protein
MGASASQPFSSRAGSAEKLTNRVHGRKRSTRSTGVETHAHEQPDTLILLRRVAVHGTVVNLAAARAEKAGRQQ